MVGFTSIAYYDSSVYCVFIDVRERGIPEFPDLFLLGANTVSLFK